MATITGTSGDDNLVGSTGNDTINGLGGSDTITGGAGNDTIDGGDGNDILTDGPGDDMVFGGDGYDTFVGGQGNDTYSGGTDIYIDEVSYANASAGVVVDLSLSTNQARSSGTADAAQIGVDQLIDISDVRGSNFDDVISGNSSSNQLYGGAGNDQLIGGDGVDTLEGSSGNDLLNGGAGEDAASYFDSVVGVTVSLAISGAQDTGDGADTLINIEKLYGSQHDDTLVGDNARNFLVGNAGADTLVGAGGDDYLIGGEGDDLLTGGIGSDQLSGDAGHDTFRGTSAELANDWVMDFQIGDKLLITDADISHFSFSVSGQTLTYTGGQLTLTAFVGGQLSNIDPSQLVARAAPGGGVQLTLRTHEVHSDFNGDGRSDVLLRADDGTLTDLLGTVGGGFAANSLATSMVDSQWQVAATGDFNGDGTYDILWHRPDGALTDWLGSPNGSFVPNGANELEVVDPQWQIAGVGDFNGDGRDDILWHRADGALTDWLGTANGSFAPNGGNLLEVVDPQWQVAGVGDFNGDGRDDVLWHRSDGATTDWLGAANGGLTPNAANMLSVIDPQWEVAAVADFNGDLRDDVLWHRSDGALTDWLGLSNGGLSPNASNLLMVVPTNWRVAASGDYNGDGRDDVLWRDGSGQVFDWLGDANGALIDNAGASITHVASSWHVQTQPDLYA